MKIVVAGDFCPNERVVPLLQRGNFEVVFGSIRETVSGADYSIVNFECPVCFGSERPIEKCGANLCCSENGIKAVKWAGFKGVTLANNHFYDYGDIGVSNTILCCKNNNLDYVGGGLNLKTAALTLYKKLGDKILAIINCCEHEFSIATEESGGSNPLNPIKQYYAIKEARQKADFILVIVHGGNEYFQLPSPRMKETYRFFIDAGADAVVNHHQHCYSGTEIYNGKPIIYGLGNLCFDETNDYGRIWNEGYLAIIDFTDMGVDLHTKPYVQCEINPDVRWMSQSEEDSFRNHVNKLNGIIADDFELNSKYNDFLKSFNRVIGSLLEPYSSRIAKGLYRRHLLPSIINDKRKLLLQGFIQCESHLPKIMKFLTNRKGDA